MKLDGAIDRLARLASHLVADVASLMLYWIIGGMVASAVSNASSVRTETVMGTYLAYCLGLVVYRYVSAKSDPSFGYRAALASHGLLFGIFVSYLAVPEGHPTGIWSIAAWSPDASNITPAIFIGLLLWFAAIMLCPVALLVPLRVGAVHQGASNRVIEAISLLCMNLIVIVVSVRWAVLFEGSEPYKNIAFGGQILVFLILLTFFLLFFAHPALYRLKQGGRLSFISYGFQCALFVWATAMSGFE